MYNYSLAFIKNKNISIPIYSAKLEETSNYNPTNFNGAIRHLTPITRDISAELYVSDEFHKYYNLFFNNESGYYPYNKDNVTLIDFEKNTALLLYGVNFKSFNNMDNKLDLVVDYYHLIHNLNELDNNFKVYFRKFKLEQIMKGW